MEVYNKNRDINKSMHDEIREQNAKLKGAPLREKLAYFKEYYLKMTLAVTACAILVVYLIYSIATAPKDSAFVAFFFNSTGDSSSTDLIDGFVAHIGLDTKKHDAYIDSAMYYSPDSADYSNILQLEKTMAVIATQELDILAGDSIAMDYFAKIECLHDITTVLPDDLLEKFQDKLYYAKTGESEALVPVGIYVSDAPKLNQYHYYTDRDAIFGFVINSNSIDNAISFLNYIYME